jgi:hypothetical protein
MKRPPNDDVAQTLTPPELARRYRIEPAKVIAFIRSGKLPAMNFAAPGCRRPRYRIRESDLAVFEANMLVQPPAPPPRRRKTTGRVFFT